MQGDLFVVYTCYLFYTHTFLFFLSCLRNRNHVACVGTCSVAPSTARGSAFSSARCNCYKRCLHKSCKTGIILRDQEEMEERVIWKKGKRYVLKAKRANRGFRPSCHQKSMVGTFGVKSLWKVEWPWTRTWFFKKGGGGVATYSRLSKFADHRRWLNLNFYNTGFPIKWQPSRVKLEI